MISSGALHQRPSRAFFLISLLLGLSVACSFFVGSGAVGLKAFFERSDQVSHFIIWNLRFPRTMSCFAVGFALGLSGRLLQSLLQNPLAEPYTLGISGGATLGAVGAIFFVIEPFTYTVPGGALIGSVLATLLLLYFSRISHLWRSRMLVLMGLLISLFCGSLVTLFLTWMRPHELQHALAWMMGQVGTERDQMWPVLLIVGAVSWIWAYKNSRDLDALLLGEELAVGSGFRLTAIRRNVIVIVAILTALSVSIAGLIGFVGLLAPHFAETLSNTIRHRTSLLLSGFCGAALLLLSDLIGRALGGGEELPVGGIIAVIGAPTLIYLMLRQKTENEYE